MSVSLALLRCPASSLRNDAESRWETINGTRKAKMAPLLAAFGSDCQIAIGNIEMRPQENPGIHKVEDRPRSRLHAIYFGFSTHNGFDEEKGQKTGKKPEPLTDLHFSSQFQRTFGNNNHYPNAIFRRLDDTNQTQQLNSFVFFSN